MKEKKSSKSIYTKNGDLGYTSNLAGDKISKADLEIEIIGQLDELMVQIEKVMSIIKTELMAGLKEGDSLEEYDELVTVRNRLWLISANISALGTTLEVHNVNAKETDVKQLEKFIDDCNIELTTFITFKNLIAIEVNEARVRTRKLERTMTMLPEIALIIKKYLNRLSDFFFALAYIIEKE